MDTDIETLVAILDAAHVKQKVLHYCVNDNQAWPCDWKRILDELRRLRESEETSDYTRELMAAILTKTVNVFRGEPDALTLWSWHDMPELATAAIVAKEAAEQRAERLREALVSIEGAISLSIPSLLHQSLSNLARAALDTDSAGEAK